VAARRRLIDAARHSKVEAPAAMSQRLVRVKAKIRDAGITFEVPDLRELADRVDSVLEAIYAAFGSGWDDVAGADPRRRGLADETIGAQVGRAAALARARGDEAREAFSRAIGLTEDDGVRAFLAAEATSRTPLS
jgi:predicted RNA polymerase sigma factor